MPVQLSLLLDGPKPMPAGWRLVRMLGGEAAERVQQRADGSTLILRAEPDVHCWDHFEHTWSVQLRLHGLALALWSGPYAGDLADGAEAAEAAAREHEALIERASVTERCPVCLAVHPHPAVFFGWRHDIRPCSWCGTDWTGAPDVAPFVGRERARLAALGWTWSGSSLVPPEAVPAEVA